MKHRGPCWDIDCSNHDGPFVGCLQAICSSGDIVIFEHSGPKQPFREIYARYRRECPFKISHDTVAPETTLYAVSYSQAFESEFTSLCAQMHNQEEGFWHIKVIREGQLLAWCHDAYACDNFFMSPLLAEDKVRKIAKAINGTYRIAEGPIDWTIEPERT